MIYHNDSTSIRTAWQGQISESLEAGETLVLEVGVSNRVLDNMPTLVALDGLAERSDLLTPWLLIGGDGVAWAAGMNVVGGAISGQASGLAPLYAGADSATYMATLATLPGPSAHTRRNRVTGLPVGLHSSLLPQSQPGVTPLWSALPFVMGAQTQPFAATIEPTAASIDQAMESGLQWFALLIVVGLIVSALFI